MLSRLLALCLTLLGLLFTACPGLGQAAASPVLSVRGLGQGAIDLSGPWQFHLGDDPAWSRPAYQDAGWEQISADSTWGEQGHPSYAGFAWYRRHLDLEPASGIPALPLAILIPPVDDAYDLYWNGEKIGSFGRVPPRALWYPGQARSFALPAVHSRQGVLALRVWKAPLASNDPSNLGGLNAPPRLGDTASISAEYSLENLRRSHGHLYDYARIVVLSTLALAAVVLWSRSREQLLLLWFGLFLISRTAVFVFGVAQLALWLPSPHSTALLQCLVPIQDGALWLVLISLFSLDGNKRLLRWTLAVFLFGLAAAVVDGVLLGFFWADAGPVMQWADAGLTILNSVTECFLFVLIYQGLRRKLGLARSLVAWSAALVDLLYIVANVSSQGMRFTHWKVSRLLTQPLHGIPGTGPLAASEMLLVLALLLAVAHALAQQQRRQSAIALEMLSAREVQKILIPEALPSIPGYSIHSVYEPAQEVGGDFFQIIPVADGTILVALGDVSGKGLKAAMIVSLIVGTLRTLAEFYRTPGAILSGLNRRLSGRMEDGFTSCLIVTLNRAGDCILANAGHHTPYLNGRELAFSGTLPLGISAGTSYEEQRFSLREGDTLTLYTDGVIEARNAHAELFGYDRLQALVGRQASARHIADEASAFGQEDDVTVLTIERLAGDLPHSGTRSPALLIAAHPS